MKFLRTHQGVPDSESESIYLILRFLALVVFGIAFALPFLWTVSTSLKKLSETTKMPPEWIPRTNVYETVIGGNRISRAEVAWGLPENRIEPAVPYPPNVDIAWVRPEGSEVAYRAVPKGDLVLRDRTIEIQWQNYLGAVRAIPFWRYTRNTLFLCFLSVIGTLVSSAIAAYGFARIQWRGRDTVFLIVLATMMIPFPVIMIPLYSLFRHFGLIGTMVPLWLPTFFGNAFFIFLLRQFFRTIPEDLTDAAKIDGCSEWRIFWNIICPLSHSALIVVAIFKFIETWNDFLGPFIFLTDQKDFTLALGLQFFQSQHGGTDWHYLMAASTLVTLPVILLFFFAQRRFIEGISMTGMKN